MGQQTFDVILLNGRPAAGKSEIIDYLKKTELEERIRRFHVGAFEEIDDFPMLWERWEDDNIYQKYGKERLYTTEGLYFKEQFFWTFLIEKINMAYAKRIREDDYHDRMTSILEFARGSEHGGWKQAYATLSDEVLSRAAIVYISVTHEESLRKNRRRYKPDQADSILFHALEDEKLDRLYRVSDWDEVSNGKKSGSIRIRRFDVPFVVFDNMPEKTDKPDLLAGHLEEVMQELWKLRRR